MGNLDNKELFRLGTFVKNMILGKPHFYNLVQDLGIDKKTDPRYVLDEVEHCAPDCFYEILEIGKKTNNIKDCVNKYLDSESNSYAEHKG